MHSQANLNKVAKQLTGPSLLLAPTTALRTFETLGLCRYRNVPYIQLVAGIGESGVSFWSEHAMPQKTGAWRDVTKTRSAESLV